MSALSYQALEQLWTEAGGPPDAAATAAAITMPESGADPSSIQPGQPYATTGWGLWQITPGNSFPDLGTDYALLDPMVNARAAVRKFKDAGNSFTPWTTYTGGQYKQYLQGNNWTGGASNNVPPATDKNLQAVFTWDVTFPVIGTQHWDMDGVVGTLSIVGGLAVVGMGVLVLIATVLKGPITQVAESYAPVRALANVQRASPGARRTQTPAQGSTSGGETPEQAERRVARAEHDETMRRQREAQARAQTRIARARARQYESGARASEGRMVPMDRTSRSPRGRVA